MPPALREALYQYGVRLEREFSGRVRRVALFGSWARGEAHEESDVDVLVVIAGATSRERLRAIEIGAEVGLDHHLVIEPVALADAQWEDLVRRELRFAREVTEDAVEVV